MTVDREDASRDLLRANGGCPTQNAQGRGTSRRSPAALSTDGTADSKIRRPIDLCPGDECTVVEQPAGPSTEGELELQGAATHACSLTELVSCFGRGAERHECLPTSTASCHNGGCVEHACSFTEFVSCCGRSAERHECLPASTAPRRDGGSIGHACSLTEFLPCCGRGTAGRDTSVSPQVRLPVATVAALGMRALSQSSSPAAAGARRDTSVSPQRRPPVAAGAALEPRNSSKRRRGDSLDRDPAVRARQTTGVFANAERLRYTEGHQRAMVESIRARHKAKGRKLGE